MADQKYRLKESYPAGTGSEDDAEEAINKETATLDMILAEYHKGKQWSG